MASRISQACFIISSSIPSRPAVSTMTMLCNFDCANFMPAFATETGSPTPFPGSGAKTGTETLSPTICNWLTALGRCKSEATSKGVSPKSLKCFASFPASVVFPAPCRPANMITVGGFLARRTRRAWPPRISMSSALTISKIAWA